MKSDRCHESNELNRLCGRLVAVTLRNGDVHHGMLRRTDKYSAADNYFDGYAVGETLFHKTNVLNIRTLKYKDVVPTCAPPVAESVCECGQALDYKKSAFETDERRACPACGRLHYIDATPDFRRAFNEEVR